MEQGKEPHQISIKEQFPLPEPLEGDLSSLDPRASLSHPDARDRTFGLSPLLSLPTGFGTAFVGSTFSCIICANNEISPGSELSISSVRIGAEIAAPSHSTALTLYPEEREGDASSHGLSGGETAQKLLKFDLREEGPHTLTVNVSYEVTSTVNGTVTGRRTRLFRKLYQFNAVPCLSVRTKATDLVPSAVLNTRNAMQMLEKSGEEFALEAQLENLTDGPITLEKVTFNAKPPFVSTSLNWDMVSAGSTQHLVAPTLPPRAIHQVCHIISEGVSTSEEPAEQKEMTKDGRVVLGTLSIKWRGPMGDPGVLSTGWLTSKRR